MPISTTENQEMLGNEGTRKGTLSCLTAFCKEGNRLICGGES